MTTDNPATPEQPQQPATETGSQATGAGQPVEQTATAEGATQAVSQPTQQAPQQQERAGRGGRQQGGGRGGRQGGGRGRGRRDDRGSSEEGGVESAVVRI